MFWNSKFELKMQINNQTNKALVKVGSDWVAAVGNSVFWENWQFAI